MDSRRNCSDCKRWLWERYGDGTRATRRCWACQGSRGWMRGGVRRWWSLQERHHKTTGTGRGFRWTQKWPTTCEEETNTLRTSRGANDLEGLRSMRWGEDWTNWTAGKHKFKLSTRNRGGGVLFYFRIWPHMGWWHFVKTFKKQVRRIKTECHGGLIARQELINVTIVEETFLILRCGKNVTTIYFAPFSAKLCLSTCTIMTKRDKEFLQKRHFNFVIMIKEHVKLNPLLSFYDYSCRKNGMGPCVMYAMEI